MSLKTVIKKCPRCRKRYFWNPDVGQIFCPYCEPLHKLKDVEDKKDTVKKSDLKIGQYQNNPD